MRIVLVSNSTWPKAIGGGEVHVAALAQCLTQFENKVSILTIDGENTADFNLTSGNVEGIAVDYLKVPKTNSFYHRDQKLTDWATRWLKEQGVDVVHFFLFGWLTGIIPAASKLGIPVFMTALDFGYWCRRQDMMYEGKSICSLGRRGSTCEQCVL